MTRRSLRQRAAGDLRPGTEKERCGMRVVINQLSTAGLKTGIGHYSEQLVRHLRLQLGHYQVDCFPRRWICEARKAFVHVRQILEKKGQATSTPHDQDSTAWLKDRALHRLRRCGRALMKYDFRSLCANRRHQLYHEPNFIAMPSDVPTVATVHDLSALIHPEWHPLDRVKLFEREFARSVGRCLHFFAISESRRREIIRILRIPPERVTRTYMGIRQQLRPLAKAEVDSILRRLRLPARYLLYLGTIEPRKNLLTLLKAYCALPRSLRDSWPLLLVGNWGWRTEEVAGYYHTEARHRGAIWRAYVSEDDLAGIYCGARALAYPSLYEGFGMPPLEMMACGGAVLSSTADALRETVGRQAHLIDPRDIDGWRDALQRVVTDQDWWAALRRGAEETARPYTWTQCALDTLKAYRRVIEIRDGAEANRVSTEPGANLTAA
jgi:glycosyltransferase involved in cell wall biosynthesis